MVETTTIRSSENIAGAETSDRADQIAQVELIRRGFPVELVEIAAEELGLTLQDLDAYGVIRPRTLSHSKRSKRFSRHQSDRVARFFRVYRTARATFGSPEKADRWLDRALRLLNGAAPKSYLDIEAGARVVEDLPARIDHGLAA